MKLITAILMVFTAVYSIQAQIVSRHYKTFKDSSYKAGDLILAPEIFFSLGSCQVLPYSADSIKIIADFVKKHPAFKIEIGVHTDSQGRKDANIILSECRARSVFDYLTKELLLPKDNFEIKGYGSSQLVIADETLRAGHCNDRPRLKNRRVEIKILKTP